MIAFGVFHSELKLDGYYLHLTVTVSLLAWTKVSLFLVDSICIKVKATSVL